MTALIGELDAVDGVAVLVDSGVEALGRSLAESLDAKVCMVVGSGEHGKTMETVVALSSQLLLNGIGRRGVLVSVGGGVVTDLGGFVSGIYMRGIRCIHVPTTMLAMCDASLGGKCGVDLAGSKNMLGLIKQPDIIAVDPEVLDSLPDAAFRDGLVEVMKKALILDAEIFAQLDGNLKALLAREQDAVDSCLASAISMKMGVVVADEKEAERRMLLNFGHTVGHAMETLSDFSLSHGEAVALGMVEETMLLSPEVAPIVKDVLHRMGLRTQMEDPAWSRTDLWQEMQRDKKVADGMVRVAVPVQVGRGEVRELTEKRYLQDGI